jgi:hypothetical protein
MKRFIVLVGLVTVCCWWSVAFVQAVPPQLAAPLHHAPGDGDCSAGLRVCPDDFCRKPHPCIRHLAPWCGVDDYCRKPFPCIWCLAPWCGLDDYCRKPCPNLCRPLCTDYYTCGHSGHCHPASAGPIPKGNTRPIQETPGSTGTIPLPSPYNSR